MLKTRETYVRNVLIKETRPLHHWLWFDFLGVLLKVAYNDWFYSRFLSEKVLNWYFGYTKKVSKYCKMEVQNLDKNNATDLFGKYNIENEIKPEFLN